MSRLTIFGVKAAVIAAIYTGLTILLGPLSYGEIQVRISDAMLILPFLPGFGMDAVIGLTIGGFLGNLASPFGYIDWVFGPVANFVAALIVYLAKRISWGKLYGLIIAVTGAILAVTLIIGYGELHLIFGMPFPVVLYVLIGEAISVGIGGTIIYIAYIKRMTK
ncbi:MAG: QueT transporter family protein [Staphylothermus sp.]|nr:QueT transporter family protein [Staphylothermus sp.]